MIEHDVAIAIVTYKSADLTIDCLRSIEIERSATRLNVVAIVVDNASGDAKLIAKAIDDYGWSSWVRLVVAPKNGGFAYGNNLAICEAGRLGPPRFVHLLNPDTVVRAGAIDALVDFLRLHPTVGVAGGSFENLDGSDWPFAFRFPTILSELEAGLQFGLATRILKPWVVARKMSPVAQPIDWVPGASMMVRWEVIKNIGGFDENYFLYFEETDFCYRAKEKGFATWYVPQSRIMHIAGQSTKVTERNVKPKRLPSYWFESRRRFFSTAYGVPYAIVTDLVAQFAISVGLVKRGIQGRWKSRVPALAPDLLRHSVLWPSNRQIPAIKGANLVTDIQRYVHAQNP